VKKGARLLVVLAFLGAGAALAFAGAAPEGYKSVGDVARDPQAWAGRDVELKATIVPGSLDRGNGTVTFLAADGAHELLVRWDPALPLPEHEAGGSLDGKSVVVSGVVGLGDEGPFLLARDMKVGCASKYEAA
jgi:cytochrome c-type biogenesis protein CcmE